MNAPVLLELARAWLELAELASSNSSNLAVLGAPIELATEAITIARRALQLSIELEKCARASLPCPERD